MMRLVPRFLEQYRSLQLLAPVKVNQQPVRSKQAQQQLNRLRLIWSGKGNGVAAIPSPSSREALPPPSPLRTVQASFPAYCSSLSNAPCGTRFRDS
jgi:hypothetical protein